MLPDAVGFTASLQDHFSFFALLLPWLMACGFCRLDRPGGSGSALEQSLAPCFFVAFRSCFSVGIGEKAPLPNQSMKPTASPRNNFSLFAMTRCRGLSLSR
jgi:hypothetical protein